jgi:uncharacterized membrane protein YadS
MLTMAMTALGMETSFKKFKEVVPAPFYVSLAMFAWLMIGATSSPKPSSRFFSASFKPDAD